MPNLKVNHGLAETKAVQKLLKLVLSFDLDTI